MALPSAASSATLVTPQGGTTLIPHSANASATNLIQQKTHIPDPFELSDPQILDIVYLTHVNDDETCDTKILFDLVSNVITHTQTSHSQIPPGSYKPEFSTLKLISCQMILTRNAPQCAHQTALWILRHLRCYSWDAKALITLAAFSLEYGNFAHLLRVPTTEILGSSLKQLNQVQERKVSNDITQLAEFIVQAFQLIKQWAAWSADVAYDYEDVPSLTEALHEIPIVVYWTIASIVASTGNLVGVSEYNLSRFRWRLNQAVERLTNHLQTCRMEIGHIDDYFNRRKAYEKPKDIVDRLKALIHRSGSTLQIYEGNVQVKMGLEVFKQKNVLLFISSLYSIGDEILLLNALYDRLQENPKESIKGYRKEDFKILWVPIVDEWDNMTKEQFRTWRNKINNWYSVECFYSLPGIKIIRDPKGLNYEDRPIVPVFNPQGVITNKDAMELIFQWGIDAFPFGEGDGNDLALKWRWLWDVIRKVAPDLEVHWDRYIFVYGGNSKWVKDFTMELEKVKRHEDIKRADVIIDYHQVGEDDKSASSFWIGIERKRQNKKHQGSVDCQIQDIAKSLFCLKRDQKGWAILAKGQNVKILGHGDPMYETLAEFEKWRGKVLVKEGFDVAFKEYYDTKVKEISVRQPCSYLNVDNYTSSVIATIACPNPTCGRVMEVTSVNYKCCHRDDPNNAPFC